MLLFLLHLLAPGEKLPTGANQISLGSDGLSPGWAFFIFVALAVLVVWTYRRFTKGLGFFTRTGLIILRCLLFALLLLLLVRPVLIATLDESTRRPFVVLLDTTQSMGVVDSRNNPDDAARGAIALGLASPTGGLKQEVSAKDAAAFKDLSRAKLLERLVGNDRLNLLPRIQQHANLLVYGFGRKLASLGELAPPPGGRLTAEACAGFFHGVHYDDNLTGIGDGLRDLLDAERGEALAGVLLITDGANNTGSSPVEAAAIAKQDGVPLYIYGVGVTSPQDIMVAGLDTPPTSNLKEKLNVTVHIRAQRMTGRQATIQLKANGKVVDEQPLAFRADGDQEVNLSYTPDAIGVVDLEAFVPPLPEEAVQTNNSATTQVRIQDEKIRVLTIQEEPSWDFQYFLLTLQRDRRMKIKAVLLKGDPDLASDPSSPFETKIPTDKEALYSNDLIVIGDVDPADITAPRMKMISDWVSYQGGGVLFLAGTKFNPNSYKGTPLDPLLPVTPGDKPAAPYDQPVHLKLTPAGEASPLLTLSQNAEQNLALWGAFAGVRWTAWVGKARPGAQSLLADPTPARSIEGSPMPVMAQESYGRGQTFFIGTTETYRWRSHQGEKYYTQIYNQIIQAITAGHRAGASSLVQLKTDRPIYLTGDKVRISGRVYQAGFTAVTDPEVPGILTVTGLATPGQAPPAPQTREVRLQAIADRPGEYEAVTTAEVPGAYSYATSRDPSISAKFQVAEPKIELADIAMNEKLLRAMAATAGGEFLREENLNGLPDLVVSKGSDAVTLKKIPLAFAPVLLGLIVLVACGEWLWRRKLELK